MKIGDDELDDSGSETLIEIPYDLTIQHHTHPINGIVNAIYHELQIKYLI